MPARTASASSGEPGAVSGSGSRTERVPVKAARVALRTCARTTRAAGLASIWVRADATEVRTSAGDEASPGWRDSSPGRSRSSCDVVDPMSTTVRIFDSSRHPDEESVDNSTDAQKNVDGKCGREWGWVPGVEEWFRLPVRGRGREMGSGDAGEALVTGCPPAEGHGNPDVAIGVGHIGEEWPVW